MPSDSYYDSIYEHEIDMKFKAKREFIEKLNKMTLEEKVDLLLKEYVNNKNGSI